MLGCTSLDEFVAQDSYELSVDRKEAPQVAGEAFLLITACEDYAAVQRAWRLVASHYLAVWTYCTFAAFGGAASVSRISMPMAVLSSLNGTLVLSLRSLPEAVV